MSELFGSVYALAFFVGVLLLLIWPIWVLMLALRALRHLDRIASALERSEIHAANAAYPPLSFQTRQDETSVAPVANSPVVNSMFGR